MTGELDSAHEPRDIERISHIGVMSSVTMRDGDSRRRAVCDAALILRDEIGRGVYPPGRAIASETALVQRFGVARLTARNAVRVLSDEGLVEVVPGRGVCVSEH